MDASDNDGLCSGHWLLEGALRGVTGCVGRVGAGCGWKGLPRGGCKEQGAAKRLHRDCKSL